MTSIYVAQTRLREIALEVLRMRVPSVTDIRLVRRGGPLVPGNWRIERIDLLAEHYGQARDAADRLEADGSWIMVPDEHPLDGLVFGREANRQTFFDGPSPAQFD